MRGVSVLTSMITRWIIATTLSPGSGYFHALQLGMADLGRDEVHVADLALILLERRDLLRVGRPDENRAIALDPASVVGGVAEVFHAVLRELRLLAGRDVAHPQIPIANERRLLAVGRQRLRRARAAASASTAAAAPRPPPRPPRPCPRLTYRLVAVMSQRTERPPTVTSIAASVGREAGLRARGAKRIGTGADRGADRRDEPRVVEHAASRVPLAGSTRMSSDAGRA